MFRKYDVPADFDLLSLDIDGNDFWVWQKIAARPRIVVIEYNSTIPVDQRLSIAYEPTFAWSGTDYSGASLRALQELGQRKGYTLIYCERPGVNAFFVANELLPERFQPPPIEEIYRLPNAGYWGIRSPRDPHRTMIIRWLYILDHRPDEGPLESMPTGSMPGGSRVFSLMIFQVAPISRMARNLAGRRPRANCGVSIGLPATRASIAESRMPLTSSVRSTG